MKIVKHINLVIPLYGHPGQPHQVPMTLVRDGLTVTIKVDEDVHYATLKGSKNAIGHRVQLADALDVNHHNSIKDVWDHIAFALIRKGYSPGDVSITTSDNHLSDWVQITFPATEDNLKLFISNMKPLCTSNTKARFSTNVFSLAEGIEEDQNAADARAELAEMEKLNEAEASAQAAAAAEAAELAELHARTEGERWADEVPRPYTPNSEHGAAAAGHGDDSTPDSSPEQPVASDAAPASAPVRSRNNSGAARRRLAMTPGAGEHLLAGVADLTLDDVIAAAGGNQSAEAAASVKGALQVAHPHEHRLHHRNPSYDAFKAMANRLRVSPEGAAELTVQKTNEEIIAEIKQRQAEENSARLNARQQRHGGRGHHRVSSESAATYKTDLDRTVEEANRCAVQ